ncbi:MAG: dual specificity protein phosphatase family protein [Nocardioides sp.]
MGPGCYVIERTGAGRLATMACPGAVMHPATELGELAASGVDVIVCLLPDDELREAGLEDEASLVRTAGMEFWRLPTPDFEVPEFSLLDRMSAALADMLAENYSIVVHCRAGIGRSATMAAAIMVHGGVEPEAAWASIGAARGVPVPETSGQEAIIDRLARSLRH